ncbi:MAG: guanylate kinase [Actinomycetota bacterium]|jgi:guanylate kinase|nr:guanylate kinase [Actinomycetota bacterium]
MLFVVSGPSGAGKGTVIRKVLSRRPDILLSVSATTRPARPGERHGIDYIFISKGEFDAMRDRGDLLESAKVYDNYYGTPRGPVEAAIAAGRSVICELDIQGALAVKRAKPEAVLIFIEPPSLDDLSLRLRGRGTEEGLSLSRRLTAAYEEVKNKGSYDHIIVNEDVRTAADELLRILDQQR